MRSLSSWCLHLLFWQRPANLHTYLARWGLDWFVIWQQCCLQTLVIINMRVLLSIWQRHRSAFVAAFVISVVKMFHLCCKRLISFCLFLCSTYFKIHFLYFCIFCLVLSLLCTLSLSLYLSLFSLLFIFLSSAIGNFLSNHTDFM